MKVPSCKNETCPRFRSRDEIVVIEESNKFVTFGCKACRGIQVVTLDWREATQTNNYIRHGRPEYARNRAYFFQGKHKIDRSY